jgi:hypothetical protein
MVALVVRPRVQKDRWSLYWKESMSTKTESLEEMRLEVDPAATPAELLRRVAEAQGWPPAGSLLRLEGFEDPWERAVFQGRELALDAPLAAQGAAGAGAVVVLVRRVLLADGWKIQADEEEDDSSSEEEDF